MTGRVAPRETLLRFVVAPDGAVVPDVAARLPGRGLWLTPSRDIVAAAVAKRAFSRAAKAPVTAPADLPERVEALLARRCGELIGLARRSGLAVGGFEKVREALRGGRVGVLVAAADGAAEGREKIAALGAGLRVVDVLTAAELGAAFGREHLVHAALAAGRLAEDFVAASGKLAGFRAGASSFEDRPRTPRRQG
jgi:hypothetical protein